LGDASFDLGDYAQARDAYKNTLGIDPTDEHARGRLDLCEKALALNPRLPGLGASQRLRRSEELVKAVAAVVSRCGGELGRQRDRATMSENLDRAVELWNGRPSGCGLTQDEQPLALIMGELRGQ